jgi:hypothetical protein
MAKEVPDHHDADLVLRVYELRREAVMRESRNAINGKFWPKSFEDVVAVTKPDHPLNAPYRQCGTYWEMVYGMVRHGIVNAEYFMETNGEGLFLFARVEPHLARIRAELNPFAFQNAEWVARETKSGARLLELFRQRVQRVLQAQQ